MSGETINRITGGEQDSEHRVALRHAKLTRTGATIALTCLAFAVQLEAISRIPTLRAHRAECFVALALIAGVLMLFRSRLAGDHRCNPETILTFYRRSRYWGFVLLAAATMTQAALPVRLWRPKVVEVAEEKPKRAPEPEPAPPTPKPREFPSLEVTGFVLNGARSTAVINGKTLMLGEDVYGVRLVEVTEAGIVVELEGERKEYGYGAVVAAGGK